jgi:hypothetical protein
LSQDTAQFWSTTHVEDDPVSKWSMYVWAGVPMFSSTDALKVSHVDQHFLQGKDGRTYITVAEVNRQVNGRAPD